LRKVTISFVMSTCLDVRLSVRMQHLVTYLTEFKKNMMFVFRKSVEKIQVSLQSV